MRGMQYLVSFALLVAVAAWIVRIYNNLDHLRGVVCSCWGQWRKATHHRNECLTDFAVVFALFLPQGDPLPRNLRRLAADSERTLALTREPRWSRCRRGGEPAAAGGGTLRAGGGGFACDA